MAFDEELVTRRQFFEEEELGISIVGGCSIEMWTSLVVCVLKMFVSTYADDKVVSESVADPEKAQTMGFDGSSLNVEALREMIDSQVDISEEERADLKESLIKLVQGRASDVLQAPTRDLVDQTFVLLSLLFVVALIFGKYGKRRAKQWD